MGDSDVPPFPQLGDALSQPPHDFTSVLQMSVRVEAADLVKLGVLALVRSPMYWLWLVLLPIAAGELAVDWMGHGDVQWDRFIDPRAASFWFMFLFVNQVWQPITYVRAARRSWGAALSLQREIQYSFGTNGMVERAHLSSEVSRWRAWKFIREEKHCFVIENINGLNAVILPKRCFAEDQIKLFRDLARRAMPVGCTRLR